MVLKVGRNQPALWQRQEVQEVPRQFHDRCATTAGGRVKSVIEQMAQRHEAAERIRKTSRGLGGRLFRSELFDRQMVAVGDTIYHSADWKTFPDFLATT